MNAWTCAMQDSSGSLTDTVRSEQQPGKALEDSLVSIILLEILAWI